MRTKFEDNERKAREATERNEIGKLPEVVDPARRARCERSLVSFMREYCVGAGAFLKTPPSAKMEVIIQHLERVILNGGAEHIRMARAHGKSSFVKCGIVWALAYGHRHFVVAVSAAARDAASMVSDIYAMCEDAEVFGDDFPEISVPIRRLGGIMQRAQNQTHGGKRTKIGKTVERIVLPTIEGASSSGAIVVARGFTSAARGLVRGSSRPDLVLFDDLQSDKVARNQATVQSYDETIEKSFMGLGGHDKQIAALMTSTPICPDDLSELYATKPGWKTFTFPMLEPMPMCWGGDDDPWKEYFDIRKNAIAHGDSPHDECNRYYAKYRAVMDAGAEVLNPDFYDHETELSGIQHAMNLLFTSGEAAFAAEYQMRPARETAGVAISSSLVVSRVRQGTAAWTRPTEAVFTAAATDLNPSYGLTTTVIAFDRRQSAFVTWYKVFATSISDRLPDGEWSRQVFAALLAHGRELFALTRAHGFVLDRWGIDANGKAWETAMAFAAASGRGCGITAFPMVGRSGSQFNPSVKTRVGMERDGTLVCADVARGWRWLTFNADMHRERSQKAWLGEVGAPGSLSLFDGARHGEFAAQATSEKLLYKHTLANGRTDYRWKSVGKKHDYGDAITMCYALAANFGLSPSVSITPPTRPRVRVASPGGARRGKVRIR